MWRAFRLHYSIVWVLILAFTEYRLGQRAETADFVVAALIQVLSFPADLLVAAAIGLSRIPPEFWGTHAGTGLGWALFFAAGYVQWFVLVPWVIRKARRQDRVS